jgi:hypothetical protein
MISWDLFCLGESANICWVFHQCSKLGINEFIIQFMQVQVPTKSFLPKKNGTISKLKVTLENSKTWRCGEDAMRSNRSKWHRSTNQNMNNNEWLSVIVHAPSQYKSLSKSYHPQQQDPTRGIKQSCRKLKYTYHNGDTLNFKSTAV